MVWISLMARSDGYNTKTRQLILDYLINNRQHAVSASNILEHLEEQGASPNPTTVYRYLDKLAGEQRIMKYVADKGEKPCSSTWTRAATAGSICTSNACSAGASIIWTATSWTRCAPT